MPYTGVFMAVRNWITLGFVDSSLLIEALSVALVYLVIFIPIYRLVFTRARRTGELVRLS